MYNCKIDLLLYKGNKDIHYVEFALSELWKKWFISILRDRGLFWLLKSQRKESFFKSLDKCASTCGAQLHPPGCNPREYYSSRMTKGLGPSTRENQQNFPMVSAWKFREKIGIFLQEIQ